MPRQYNVAEIEFPTNSTEIIEQPCGKKNLDVDLILFTKVNSKWITHLNIGCKTRKLLKDNIGKNLNDLGYGGDLLNTTPWSMNW